MQPLSKVVIAGVAVAITIGTVALVVMLWWAGTRGLTGDKLVTARFDALRTGLGIGLGSGGLFALYLGWRRQRSTEIGLAQKQQDQADVARAYELQRETAEASQRDAEARRITDLYTKAVEQLGSDKAPVRLGGLYALERLAQDHIEQRRTIVNVLCAYLRMPYTLPASKTPTRTASGARTSLRPTRGRPATHRPHAVIAINQDRAQEREVRLTAQRILAIHLHPGNDRDHPVATFWEGVELDLTGAVLVNLDLQGCVIHNARFGSATFNGTANFGSVIFIGTADFRHASFTNSANFESAEFAQSAEFDSAIFQWEGYFQSVSFANEANFDSTTFTESAHFDSATFAKAANFGKAVFNGMANFASTTITETAYFPRARFASAANFGATVIEGDANFVSTIFSGKASFKSGTFSTANFRLAEFRGSLDFESASFTNVTKFNNLIGQPRNLTPVETITVAGKPLTISTGEVLVSIYTGSANFASATLPTVRYAGDNTPEPWANFTDVSFLGGTPPEVAEFASPQRSGNDREPSDESSSPIL